VATDGQEAFTSGNFEFPVNPDVEPTAQAADFGRFRADQLHSSELGRHNADAIRLMAEVGYE
jgi:iron(III) transport system substrate-binding protein